MAWYGPAGGQQVRVPHKKGADGRGDQRAEPSCMERGPERLAGNKCRSPKRRSRAGHHGQSEVQSKCARVRILRLEQSHCFARAPQMHFKLCLYIRVSRSCLRKNNGPYLSNHLRTGATCSHGASHAMFRLLGLVGLSLR